MPSPRRPAGYIGQNHETLGSDVQSIFKVVSFPDSVLGPELAATLSAAQPERWYPIGPLLEAMEKLDQKIGRAGLLQMGRNLFRMSHADRVKQLAKSAGDIIFSLND